MGRIVIREANALDFERIDALHSTAAREMLTPLDLVADLDAGLDAARDQIFKDLTEPSPATYWIAHVGDTPAGFAKVTALGPGHSALIELELLTVSPLFRIRGIASRLMKASLGDISAVAWPVQGEQTAQKFLTARGFTATGKTSKHPVFPEITRTEYVRA